MRAIGIILAGGSGTTDAGSDQEESNIRDANCRGLSQY